MMRYLLISFCLCLVGCGSYSKKQDFQETTHQEITLKNPYFSDETIDYVYKAQIDIYDRNFGGLLIIKKIEKDNHRVAFTTEMGTKLFDFSFIEDDFKVNYIIDDFDKALLINILKQDFQTLIKEKLEIKKSFSSNNQEVFETSLYNKRHFYFIENESLVTIIRTKGPKEKVRFQFSNISDSIAKKIDIIHYNIKLKINLKSIN